MKWGFSQRSKGLRGEIDCFHFRGFERSQKRLNSDDSFIVGAAWSSYHKLGHYLMVAHKSFGRYQ